MELIVAVVAIVVMTLLSGSVLSKIYEGAETSTRFFRETHVSAASINTLIVGGLLAVLFQFPIFAVASVAVLMALTWVAFRLIVRVEGTRILWDKIDMLGITTCLVVSVFGSYVLSSTLGSVPGMEPLYVGLIYAACWVLLFPL